MQPLTALKIQSHWILTRKENSSYSDSSISSLWSCHLSVNKVSLWLRKSSSQLPKYQLIYWSWGEVTRGGQVLPITRVLTWPVPPPLTSGDILSGRTIQLSCYLFYLKQSVYCPALINLFRNLEFQLEYFSTWNKLIFGLQL